MVKAVVLLSGGLDSTLAACIVKEQGVELEAVNFQTMFGCCKNDARQVAHQLGLGFTVLKVKDDYISLIKNPKHGYGRGINPCVDCRGYMFELAHELMEKTGASFLISGEVLGQRPMSQKKRDFQLIEQDTGLEGKILRPLSAKLLPETEVEKSGVIDRSKLYGIQGRSRRQLLELAHKYGIEDPPDPSSGCALTSPEFAQKVRDLFVHHQDSERWYFEILKTGRHFRLEDDAKLIVGRNQEENIYLEHLHPENTALLTPVNFAGPTAILIGTVTDDRLKCAGSVILRYAQKPLPEQSEISMELNGAGASVFVTAPAEETLIDSLRI
ncbi:MAG: 7-cyano-7-deazaguanine synthase [Candidatus Omnitrophica bacterium]|nr:7-cyano-7-deazaguanine synthase [Candidatus Omnitrophota bacterium]